MSDKLTIFAGHSFSIVFKKYEDDGTTPFNFSGTYKLVFCRDVNRKDIALTLTEASGLTKVDNVITASVVKSKNFLKPGHYFVDLHNDIDADSSYPEVQQIVEVKPSR